MLSEGVLQSKGIKYLCTIKRQSVIIKASFNKEVSAMKRYKNITVIEKQIDKVICNGCGKEIDRHADYLSVDKAWGYGVPFDGQNHTFDLCGECYKKITDGFKISVVNNDEQ